MVNESPVPAFSAPLASHEGGQRHLVAGFSSSGDYSYRGCDEFAPVASPKSILDLTDSAQDNEAALLPARSVVREGHVNMCDQENR
jgi:hypothetical protein